MKKYKCPYCDKTFERPYKYKTETEGFHILECEFKDLKQKIKKGNSFEKAFSLITLKNISLRYSIRARKGSKAYKRMIEIQKILEENETKKN